MSEDDGWVVRTALDPEATPGEFEACLRNATEAERLAIQTELELAIAWAEDRQRDLAGKLAHLREQYPGLASGGYELSP